MYVATGLLVGLLVGRTGVGGGSLMTPVLVLFFDFHPVTAVGTDLLYAAGTKLAGTGMHEWRGTVEWRVVRRLAAGSLPASMLTLLALYATGLRAQQANAGIAVALGVVLILTGVATLLRQPLLARLAVRPRVPSDRYVGRWTVALGVLLGTLVTLTSVGAGALGMTALLILYPTLPVARLVGTDIAHAGPLTLIAGLGHWAMGSVDAGLLMALLCGSVPGVLIGSMVASRTSDRVLTPLLAAVLAVVGWRLLA